MRRSDKKELHNVGKAPVMLVDFYYFFDYYFPTFIPEKFYIKSLIGKIDKEKIDTVNYIWEEFSFKIYINFPPKLKGKETYYLNILKENNLIFSTHIFWNYDDIFSYFSKVMTYGDTKFYLASDYFLKEYPNLKENCYICFREDVLDKLQSYEKLVYLINKKE